MLAEAPTTVMVFETGLPTRYYLDRPSLKTEVLERSDTQTACPVQGHNLWLLVGSDPTRRDQGRGLGVRLPNPAAATDRWLVAFYNEKVDIVLAGVRLERPKTHLV